MATPSPTSQSAPARVLLVVGSLRERAFNRRLGLACRELMPPHWRVTPAPSLGDLPLYNQDFEVALPPPVRAWREALAAHDAVVVLTPEYNHGMPGVLKNAIDWASNPPSAMPLSGKAVAIAVTTTGSVLGRSGLDEARRVLLDMGNYVVPTPQVILYRAAEILADVPGTAAGAPGSTEIRSELSKNLLRALFAATDDALAAGAGPLARAGIDHLQRLQGG